MEVDRHGVGDRDFIAGRADQFRDPLGERFRHREPGGIAVEPAGDAAGFPLFEDAEERALGIARQQAKRISVEINSPLGRIETFAKCAERIGIIQLLGEGK